MGVRDIGQFSIGSFDGRVRSQRHVAAYTDPLAEFIVMTIACLQHHDVMIAAQWDKVVVGVPMDQPVNDRVAVGATIWVIAQRDDGVVVTKFDRITKRPQRCVATVYVTNRKSPSQREVRLLSQDVVQFAIGCLENSFGVWVGNDEFLA